MPFYLGILQNSLTVYTGDYAAMKWAVGRRSLRGGTRDIV